MNARKPSETFMRNYLLIFYILHISMHLLCADREHEMNFKRVCSSAVYWNQKYLERNIQNVKYLTLDEKIQAYPYCEKYLNRYSINTAHSPSELPYLLGYYGTGFVGCGVMLLGMRAFFGEDFGRVFSFKSIFMLTSAPVWMTGYVYGVASWNQKIQNSYNQRTKMIQDLPHSI